MIGYLLWPVLAKGNKEPDIRRKFKIFQRKYTRTYLCTYLSTLLMQQVSDPKKPDVVLWTQTRYYQNLKPQTQKQNQKL